MSGDGVTSIPRTDFEVGLDRESRQSARAIGRRELRARSRRGGVLVFASGSTYR